MGFFVLNEKETPDFAVKESPFQKVNMDSIALLNLIMPTAAEALMTYQQLVVWIIVLVGKVLAIVFVLWFLVKVVGVKITVGK